MKKIYLMGAILLVIGLSIFVHQKFIETAAFSASSTKNINIPEYEPPKEEQQKEVKEELKKEVKEEAKKEKEYVFPEFYRGFYLTVTPALKLEEMEKWVKRAKQANMNCMVIDVQDTNCRRKDVPKENIQYLLDNGIHPIARIFIFSDGLKQYPPSEALLKDRYDVAITACEAGFKEIQFDYIRFNDSNVAKNLSMEQRYVFIEGILKTLREKVKKYNVRTAADVFGRIPPNKNDLIGQKMESLDPVVDIICPMAYPSHYTWSKKLQHDPYQTVLMTSQKAVERTKHAEIVTWIQAFEMRLGPNTFPDYIKKQIQAVHDSGAKGYFLWNARHQYDTAFKVAEEYYKNGRTKS
jgi:hypothetical protein